jgi:hypothetical protein
MFAGWHIPQSAGLFIYALQISRSMFKSEKKVGIHECGPCFVLKLRSLQKGTLDSEYGEHE